MSVDESGRFLGHLKSTGIRPKFGERLADNGIRLRPEIFTQETFVRRMAGSR
jgi:pilus assembly protein CpaF